ncbi:MAG TPA: response regulator [Candidatus Wolfebacteria bacterium]|nr:response regulator [Candidatus Wolfebacteria bacterium]
MEQKQEHKYRILMFVEDEPDLIELYRIAFESAGFLIQGIGTGEEAVEVMDKLIKEEIEAPSVVILDILLPGISGMDVLREIRKHEKFNKIPVIMFTNYSSDDIREEVKNTKNAEYVLKMDATPDQLVEIAIKKIEEAKKIYNGEKSA